MSPEFLEVSEFSLAAISVLETLPASSSNNQKLDFTRALIQPIAHSGHSLSPAIVQEQVTGDGFCSFFFYITLYFYKTVTHDF